MFNFMLGDKNTEAQKTTDEKIGVAAEGRKIPEVDNTTRVGNTRFSKNSKSIGNVFNNEI